MIVRSLAAVAAAFALATGALPAAAQPKPAPQKPAPAPAPSPGDDVRAIAASHFKQGQAYFKLGDYDRAIAEYQAAFDLSAEPSLIFNIGLCHVRANRSEEALASFKRYLELAPDGSVSEEAREEVARLTPIVEKAAADRDAKAAAERAAQQKAEEAQRREAARRAARERANAPPSRVPLYVMIGGGVAAAVGVTFHVLAFQSRNTMADSTSPDSYFDARDAFRTQRVVSIVGYSVGAAALATGLIRKATVVRRAEVEVSAAPAPGGATVMVGWSR